MQEPGKGLVTVVCNFLLSTPTRFDWVGFWMIKNGDHTSGKTRLFFVQEATATAMGLVIYLLQFQRRNMMTY